MNFKKKYVSSFGHVSCVQLGDMCQGFFSTQILDFSWEEISAGQRNLEKGGVLCSSITGLCIADKRSQHLANFQQTDDNLF